MEPFDPNRAHCTLLRDFDSAFAWKINQACWIHDQEYVLRQGSRIASDLKFIAAMADVSVWRAFVYGFFILTFGWYLWYDVDKWVQKPYNWILSKFK